MKRLNLSDEITSKIVGHVELLSGRPMGTGEMIGVDLATHSIIRMIQNNYRRRRRAR